MLEKLITFVLMAAMVLAILLGVDWLLWKLWCWVLPQLWESGPPKFINPGFWLFVAATTLFSVFASQLRGRGK